VSAPPWSRFPLLQIDTVGICWYAIPSVFAKCGLFTFSRVSLNVAYPVEILPYRIRANVLMIQSLATNLALFFGQYVTPLGIDNAGWKFYFLYEGFLLIQVKISSQNQIFQDQILIWK
jgi:hypothetical protein